jgi:ABC-2 type transport system permease protein
VADSSDGLLHRIGWDARAFSMLAAMWIRVSWSYRTSFVMVTCASFVITAVDFAAILVMFSHVDRLGGFVLSDIAFLYGATALCLGIADLVIGNIERLGQRIRTGTFDALMVRPVGVLVQVCADEFALRRIGRVVQGGLVLSWALLHVDVAWSPAKVVVTICMVVFGTLIFGGIFVLGAAFQFVSSEGSEVANAFTYGGNAMTQYPLTIYPAEAVKAMTFIVPVAFVNWYPTLFVLDKADPFGLPSWLQLASPVAAVVVCGLAVLAWRSGVRHYRSTGS